MPSYKFFHFFLYSLIFLCCGLKLWADVEKLEACLTIPNHYLEPDTNMVEKIKQDFANNSLLVRSLDIRKEGDLDTEIKYTSAPEGNTNRSATLLVKNLPIKVYYDLGALINIKDSSDISGVYKGDIGSGTGAKKEITSTAVNFRNFANLIKFYERTAKEMESGDSLPHNEVIFTNRLNYINGAWFKTPSENQTEAALIIDALRIINRMRQKTKINYPVFKYQSKTGSLTYFPLSKSYLISKLDDRQNELKRDFGNAEAANQFNKILNELDILNACK